MKSWNKLYLQQVNLLILALKTTIETAERELNIPIRKSLVAISSPMRAHRPNAYTYPKDVGLASFTLYQ